MENNEIVCVEAKKSQAFQSIKILNIVALNGTNVIPIPNAAQYVKSSYKTILPKPGVEFVPEPPILYKCQFCDKTYTVKLSWRKHMLMRHKVRPIHPGNMKCPACPIKLNRHELLREHIHSAHKIPLLFEKLEFKTFMEFEEWKAKMESETSSLYNPYSSRKPIGRTLDNVIGTSQFGCCRSAYTRRRKKTKGVPELYLNKKDRPPPGCERIDGICPSTISVTSWPNKVEVEFWKTHFGHLLDSSHVHVISERAKPAKNCKTKLIIKGVKSLLKVPGETSEVSSGTCELPGENSELPGETSNLPGETSKLPGETSESPAETSQTNNYRCRFCEMTFVSRYSWHNHMDSVHSLRPVSSGRIKCPECHAGFSRYEMLRKHVSGNHGVTFELEEWKFMNNSDFEAWKLQMEKDTKCCYIRYSGAKATSRVKNNPEDFNGKTYHYICNRSGYYNERSNVPVPVVRKRKSPAKRKINGFCPSTMVVREKSDSIHVEYWKTHFGHEFELKHLRIPKDEKKKIEAKLLAGFTPGQILETIKEETQGQELSRLHLIKKKDIDILWKRLKEREIKSASLLPTEDDTNPWGWVDSVVELEDVPDESEKEAFLQNMESLNTLVQEKLLSEANYKILNRMLNGCLNVFNDSLDVDSFVKNVQEVVPEQIENPQPRFQLVNTAVLKCEPFVDTSWKDPSISCLDKYVNEEEDNAMDVSSEFDHSYSSRLD